MKFSAATSSLPLSDPSIAGLSQPGAMTVQGVRVILPCPIHSFPLLHAVDLPQLFGEAWHPILQTSNSLYWL